MAHTAAHLVDHVSPLVPVRQWALSLPSPLRVLPAAQPLTPMLQVVHRVLTNHLLAQDHHPHAEDAHPPGCPAQRAGLHQHDRQRRNSRRAQAAACTYRVAFGPRAGQNVLTLQGLMPRVPAFKQDLCANLNGFGLRVAVPCGADERKALEQLCQYTTHSALANERVQGNAAGQVVQCEPSCGHRRPARTSWARPLKCVVQVVLRTVRTAAAS